MPFPAVGLSVPIFFKGFPLQSIRFVLFGLEGSSAETPLKCRFIKMTHLGCIVHGIYNSVFFIVI
nr:hypothetical protein [Mucilaginibacter sp. X5P1]